MTAQRLPKPVMFGGVEPLPRHREVIVRFNSLFDSPEPMLLPFHEAVAFWEALGRLIEDYPPQKVRQYDWPRVLGQ